MAEEKVLWASKRSLGWQATSAKMLRHLVIATLQDHAFATYMISEEHVEAPPPFHILKQVPPPMLEDNYDFDSECLTGEMLHEAVVPDLTQVRIYATT